MSVFHSSPPVSAYSAQPYDVSELDAMPDSDRMWATVLHSKKMLDAAISEHEERNSHLCYDDDDLDRAEEDGAQSVKDSIERILDEEISNAEKLEKLEGLL